MCIAQEIVIKKPDPLRGPAPWLRAAGNGKKPAARGPRLTAVECDVFVGAIFADHCAVFVAAIAVSLNENIIFAFGAIYRSVPDTIFADNISLAIRTIFYCRLVAISALDGLAIWTEISVFLAIVGGNAIDKKPAAKRGVAVALDT